MNKLTVSQSADGWRAYWGVMPLPDGASVYGVVNRNGERGALIKLKSGVYVQGNAGGIKNLPQDEVIFALYG